MSSQEQKTAQELELGQLYFDRGDYQKALPHLEKASESALEEKDFSLYLECQNIVLRIYAESGKDEQILGVKEKLQDMVLREGFQLTSPIYTTLGVCANFRCQYEAALEYFKKALELGLASDNKEHICRAIQGIATCYANMGRYTDALKEVYNLRVFFEFIDIPEVKFAVELLNGKIHYNLERYEEALENYWSCYDMLESLKSPRRLPNVLYRLGITYRELGDANMAKVYLQLAHRSVDTENCRLTAQAISEALEAVGVSSGKEFDLVLGTDSNVVVERKRGKVDFKNQFILLDLLHLLARNPGKTFSKEDLVKNIWKQDYNPSVHDNKIYVTIKRLRKMIEPDYDKPKYVFRGKSGYYLNKATRVLVEQ